MQKKKQSQKKKKSSKREELTDNLIKMIRDIDEEGLIFLTKQANVLLYNMRVEEINKNLNEMEEESVVQRREVLIRNYAVDLEEKNNGEHFYILLNNARVFFIREEMRKLVKICHASNDKSDAAQRLYNWFLRNRKDLLIDGEIESSKNPYLANLYEKLVSTYRVKDG
jgi:hypothetical protein